MCAEPPKGRLGRRHLPRSCKHRGPDVTAWPSPGAAATVMLLQMPPVPAPGLGWSHSEPGSALVPRVVNSWSWSETSEKRACEEVSASLLSSLLLIFSCVTAKGPEDNRTFYSVGICSFCFCLCPHRMLLSAPCEGTSNYRAIHPHPRNFRQTAEKVCRWHWNRTCCRFCVFS